MFTRDDVVGRRRVVLVSETAARTFWPNQDAIGRPVSVGGPDTEYVAGVVGDVSYGPLDAEPRPDVYVSYYQAPLSYRMMLFMRTRVDPSSLANQARTALREVAPGFPVYDVRPLDDHVRDATDYARVSAQVLALFAALALALAMIGTYGVIAFAVTQRTREIGVRIALGATSADVIRLVVGQGLALGAAGGAIGLTAAVALTRSLRSLLYGVEPTDTVTLAGIVAILLLAVIVASWVPARRAAGVPAMRALRGD
jgi:ABC-type antimicrobial peptide transport system permease subunit